MNVRGALIAVVALACTTAPRAVMVAQQSGYSVTGTVVEQHTGMAKTFTQGRAMTDNTSEAAVLGDQDPAHPAPAKPKR